MFQLLKYGFVLMLSIALFVYDAGAQSNQEIVDEMDLYYTLYQDGELNQIEYYQLKREYLMGAYDFSKLQLLRGMPEKSKKMIIAGSVLIPFGAGMIGGGINKRNKEVYGGPDGAYEQRAQMNDRVGIGFMVAGAVIIY